MERRLSTSRPVIILFLVFQFIPFVLFPPESFSPTSQEWWLPVMLGVMVLFADVQLIFGRTNAVWPWNLMSFAQGFNIISRLMMIWPHATINVAGGTALNISYIGLTLLSLILSGLMLTYVERPDIRMSMAKA